MHAGSWRVCYYNIRFTMLFKETVIAYINDITGKKMGMIDIIEGGIFNSICNSFFNQFNADYFFSLPA